MLISIFLFAVLFISMISHIQYLSASSSFSFSLSIVNNLSDNNSANEEPISNFNSVIKIAPPVNGVYNSANPDFGGTEDRVSAQKILDYQEIIDKEIVWAYFSNNWINEIKFPEESVKTIDDLDIVPFIRMMPRTSFDQGTSDPVFTLQNIIDGKFDSQLTQWALDAKRTNIPLMVEFGTEVNGDWFPWSGIINGGGETEQYGDPATPDGPERFRDAYRHIIDLFASQEVNNITWVFHVVPSEHSSIDPDDEPWNNIENYYPGDDYIDWIGTSIYGSIEPNEQWYSFSEIMDKAYPELAAISAEKPLAILEMGIIEDSSMGNKSTWIKDALQDIQNEKYPRIKALSYWNEKWEEDNTLIDLSLNSSAEVVQIYRNIISSPFFLTEAQYQIKREE